MQTFCSNVYTDRWVYHLSMSIKGATRSVSEASLHSISLIALSSFLLLYSYQQLRMPYTFILYILTLVLLLLPFSSRLTTLDTAILGNMALILALSLKITYTDTTSGAKQFYTSVQLILIYLPLLYPGFSLERRCIKNMLSGDAAKNGKHQQQDLVPWSI